MQKTPSTSLTPRADFLRQLITERASTGEPVESLCRRHGISTATYYYWHKKLQSPPPEPEPKIDFIRYTAPTPTEYEIRLSNGRSLLIRGAVDRATLTELVLAVEDAR